jgi:hypothetical protein
VSLLLCEKFLKIIVAYSVLQFSNAEQLSMCMLWISGRLLVIFYIFILVIIMYVTSFLPLTRKVWCRMWGRKSNVVKCNDNSVPIYCHVKHELSNSSQRQLNSTNILYIWLLYCFDALIPLSWLQFLQIFCRFIFSNNVNFDCLRVPQNFQIFNTIIHLTLVFLLVSFILIYLKLSSGFVTL